MNADIATACATRAPQATRAQINAAANALAQELAEDRAQVRAHIAECVRLGADPRGEYRRALPWMVRAVETAAAAMQGGKA